MGSRGPPSSGNGGGRFGFRRQENRVTIRLTSKSKQEMKEIRRKLVSELDLVRKLVRKIEANESSMIVDVGSRPLNHLSISVLENSQGASDNVEKDKRTPKANQYYRKSEFLLAKDRIPPGDSHKKPKPNGKKQGAGDNKFSNQVFKSCSSVLEKLMKHKHGWVFNKPVDPMALGLHDYFDIIKHPMDLGTVKSRLDKNWYNSPTEFAEDVRLTFQNAMKYNPKGQDVHVMAEVLLKMFEDKWKVIEADFMRELRPGLNNEVGLPTAASNKPPLPLLPPSMMPVFDKSKSAVRDRDPKAQPTNFPHLGRTPSLKKPKAKDPNKREMTYDEKQRLSTSLQCLPSEKLDSVVQIIKKRNPSLSQKDDEIEVDIDTFDTETLWELDRFVTNYKKVLSKIKRKAERSHPERVEVEPNVQEVEPSLQEKNLEADVVDAPEEPSLQEKNLEADVVDAPEEPTLQEENLEADVVDAPEEPTLQEENLEADVVDAPEEPSLQEKNLEADMVDAPGEPSLPEKNLEADVVDAPEEPNLQEKNLEGDVMDAPEEAKTDKTDIPLTSPVQVEKVVAEVVQAYKSSSSSSGSESGSSSSDSDSDSSSREGSDVAHSPKA